MKKSKKPKEMDIDTIESRANAATKWSPDECGLKFDEDSMYPYAPQGASLGSTLVVLDDTYDGSGTDWLFLAHAREDVPLLCGEIRRLRGLIETMSRQAVK